jgi:hypothetical protein
MKRRKNWFLKAFITFILLKISIWLNHQSFKRQNLSTRLNIFSLSNFFTHLSEFTQNKKVIYTDSLFTGNQVKSTQLLNNPVEFTKLSARLICMYKLWWCHIKERRNVIHNPGGQLSPWWQMLQHSRLCIQTQIKFPLLAHVQWTQADYSIHSTVNVLLFNKCVRARTFGNSCTHQASKRKYGFLYAFQINTMIICTLHIHFVFLWFILQGNKHHHLREPCNAYDITKE